MPWKKPKPLPFVEVSRLIKGYGFNQTSFATLLGCSRATAKKKLENPKLLTLDELDTLRRFGHVPADEIRGSIKFE